MSAPGGVCKGVSAPGRLPARGGVSQHALRQTSPVTEWQTGVKTLPCRNFVADGNKSVNIPVRSYNEGSTVLENFL